MVSRAQALAESRMMDLPQRLDHVRGVAQATAKVVDALGLENGDVLLAAAWLHDIGYAASVRRTGFHPVDGAGFVAGEGFPDSVVSLIAHHSGAEVEATERGLEAELARFTPPDRDDLDVLTYADMTTSPTGDNIAADDRLEEILHRYSPQDAVHRAVCRSGPGLRAAVARVETRLAARLAARSPAASQPQPR